MSTITDATLDAIENADDPMLRIKAKLEEIEARNHEYRRDLEERAMAVARHVRLMEDVRIDVRTFFDDTFRTDNTYAERAGVNLDDVNNLLDRIGCEPLRGVREYSVTGTISVAYTITVEAESESEAEDLIINAEVGVDFIDITVPGSVVDVADISLNYLSVDCVEED